LGKNRKTLVTREDVLGRSTSEYEALIAIAKEARRLNAVPGVHLKGDEKAIPKAVANFVAGKVDYEVEGVPASEPAIISCRAGRKTPTSKARRKGRKAK